MNIKAMVKKLIEDRNEFRDSLPPYQQDDMKERFVQCPECGSWAAIWRMVRLSDEVSPGKRGFYHRTCAHAALARHQNICAVCDQQYTDWHPDGEYSGVCKDCQRDKRIRKELQRVWYESKRTSLSTLTIKEWLGTLDYFGWSCAYCGHSPFYALEHFIPVRRGGGTTRDNCIPACHNCNSTKHSRDPFDTNLPNVHLVADYLARFR